MEADHGAMGAEHEDSGQRISIIMESKLNILSSISGIPRDKKKEKFPYKKEVKKDNDGNIIYNGPFKSIEKMQKAEKDWGRRNCKFYAETPIKDYLSEDNEDLELAQKIRDSRKNFQDPSGKKDYNDPNEGYGLQNVSYGKKASKFYREKIKPLEQQEKELVM